MKKFFIAIAPFVLFLWIALIVSGGFVLATGLMVVIISLTALGVWWLQFVEEHFPDN